MGPVITLTTDFGEHDAYVAAMKGVIASIAPESNILDLTHEIAPQNIREGALFLQEALPWFPEGSVHIAVVDPGVGTERRPLALNLDGRILVCPDNGLAGFVMQKLPLRESIILDPLKCATGPVSNTFHGRDIFAPAAAKIAAGTPMKQLGNPTETITELPWTVPERTSTGTILGEVIHIDRFGNCITNIPGEGLPVGGQVLMRMTESTAAPLLRTYGDVNPGEPLALVGSSGLLEFAVNQGDAASEHGIVPGAPVSIIVDSEKA